MSLQKTVQFASRRRPRNREHGTLPLGKTFTMVETRRLKRLESLERWFLGFEAEAPTIHRPSAPEIARIARSEMEKD